MAEFTKFPGLFTDVDPLDLPAGGAVVQTNVMSLVPGKLTGRGGIQAYSFATAIAGTDDVIAMYGYRPPVGQYAAVLDANGDVYLAGRTSSSTLETGVCTAKPPCWTQTRAGRLIRVNGMERGSIYNGENLWPLGITAPTAAPTVTRDAGNGAAAAGTYYFAYRWLDRQGVPSSLSPLASLTTVADDDFSWDSTTASTENRMKTTNGGSTEKYRSLVDDPSVLYKFTSGTITAISVANPTVVTSGSHGLTTGDYIQIAGSNSTPVIDGSREVTVLTANTFTVGVNVTVAGTSGAWTTLGSNDQAMINGATPLPILNDDGTLHARRFEPPPIYMGVVCPYRDRYFYCAGTALTLAEFQANVSSWTTALVGLTAHRDGQDPSPVASVVPAGDNYTIHLDNGDNFLNTASATIGVSTDWRRRLAYSEMDEAESVPATQNVLDLLDATGANDGLVGMMQHGSVLWLLCDYHVYRFTYITDPALDGASILTYSRGALNNNCADWYRDTAFLLDAMGPWAMAEGGMIEEFGAPVADYWRDGTVDLTKRTWFFVQVEPNQQVARFHVAFTGDTGTRPKRALCYGIRTGAWWLETYPKALGGGCRFTSSGRLVCLVGGEDGDVYQIDAGTAELTATGISGTATSAAAGTLVDSAAPFGAVSDGAPVAITAGTGAGQTRYIASSTSSTLTLTEEWTTTPDATSQYMVGAIECTYRTGRQTIPVNDPLKIVPDDNRRQLILGFHPTTGQQALDMRIYYDYDTTPVVFPGPRYCEGPVTIQPDDSDVLVDMKLTRSSRGNATGIGRLPFHGRANRRVIAHRYLSAELHWYQGAEDVSIASLEIEGAV